MVDPAVMSRVEDYLRNLVDQGIAVSFGVVFGSQAAGGADPRSDIDVVVVSPIFDGQSKRCDVDRLWHVAARTDSRIEPIPCGQQQWHDDTASAVIEIARSVGTTVTPAK